MEANRLTKEEILAAPLEDLGREDLAVRLAHDVEQFIARGGKVEQLPYGGDGHVRSVGGR